LQINAVDRLEDQLSSWWEEFERTGTICWKGNAERIDCYSHTRMAREFAAVFESALAGTDGPR